MSQLATIVTLLVSKVFLIVGALGAGSRCSSSFLLLGKCCALGCHRNSSLDDQWLEVIHERKSCMTAARECFNDSFRMIITHSLLQLTMLLVVAITEKYRQLPHAPIELL